MKLPCAAVRLSSACSQHVPSVLANTQQHLSPRTRLRLLSSLLPAVHALPPPSHVAHGAHGPPPRPAAASFRCRPAALVFLPASAAAAAAAAPRVVAPAPDRRRSGAFLLLHAPLRGEEVGFRIGDRLVRG
ncbi:unnamed protein product [Urochloa humidicola]